MDLSKFILILIFCSISGLASKPKLLSISKELDLLENLSFALQCYVLSGSKPLFFDWFKNGHKLFNSTKVKIDSLNSISTLSLSDLHRDDSGVYSCSVKNAFGNDSTSTIINIKGFYKSNFI